MGRLRILLHAMRKLRMYVGKNPRILPGPCIVFFPIAHDVLFCGVAGFLAIKGSTVSGDHGIPERFSEYLDGITVHGIMKIISGKTALQDYLNPQSLESFEKELYCLKQDSHLQHVLCCGNGIVKLRTLAQKMAAFIKKEDNLLEKKALSFSSGDLEVIAARLITMKDIAWGLREDLLKNQDKIVDLAGEEVLRDSRFYCRYQKINSCLNALDRLEVRGRDSAGLQVMLQLKSGKDLDALRHTLEQQGFSHEFLKRSRPGDLLNGSIHVSSNMLIFTYKTALITGVLGENTSKLRRFIRGDDILKTALAVDAESEMYLAHRQPIRSPQYRAAQTQLRPDQAQDDQEHAAHNAFQMACKGHPGVCKHLHEKACDKTEQKQQNA
jgi:glucosamine--fructose-6-phosphate aminotransferase (isomerizing)